MTIVFSTTPLRSVHDVNVRSAKGRLFVIDIYQSSPTSYDSTVTVLDNVSNPPGSWMYKPQPNTGSANDNFKAAVELIQNYLSSRESADSIVDIHNPCNCPFVSQGDQDAIAFSLGISKKVRVN